MTKSTRSKRRRVVLSLLALLALVLLCGQPRPTTLGSFNIRTFPATTTDPDAVARAIAEFDADVFAVQEIVDREAFDRVLEQASLLAGRQYKATLVPAPCLGTDIEFHLGVVHDAQQLQLTGNSFLGDARCPEGQPAGMVARFEDDDGERFVLTSIHFSAGDSAERRARRAAQWRWLLDAIPVIRATYEAPVIVAGDFNSTGYLRRGDPERVLIDNLVDEHDLQLPTRSLECSMYWQPKPELYDVSLLDHVLAPASLRVHEAEVLGMCEALRCERQATAPHEYDAVSDHCPVRVRVEF